MQSPHDVVAKRAKELKGQVRYGTAVALTKTAQQARDVVKASLPVVFDRPTPFTMSSVTIKPASKSNLVSTVLIKDLQAQYLAMQETGGEGVPQPGSPINLPVEQRTNAYGNISRGAIGRAKATGNVFVADGKGRTADLPPGLYQRLGVRKRKVGVGIPRGSRAGMVTTGRGKQKSLVKLLVAFEQAARYRPRLGFHERVEAIVTANLRENIEREILAARASAK
jgi:hypothetical protein